MRKVYIKPEMEIVAYLHESNLMDHSDHHIGAKGFDFDDNEINNDNSDFEGVKNLWDE